jgi:hypothetical protein
VIQKSERNPNLRMAIHETRQCFDRLQSQMNRLRKLVQRQEEHAPEAFRASLDEIMPDFSNATYATVSTIQVVAQIKCGQRPFHEDQPEISLE